MIGVSVSVLYLQLRWTQLILAEWRQAREGTSAQKNLDAEQSPQGADHSDDEPATKEPSQDSPSP